MSQLLLLLHLAALLPPPGRLQLLDLRRRRPLPPLLPLPHVAQLLLLGDKPLLQGLDVLLLPGRDLLQLGTSDLTRPSSSSPSSGKKSETSVRG